MSLSGIFIFDRRGWQRFYGISFAVFFLLSSSAFAQNAAPQIEFADATRNARGNDLIEVRITVRDANGDGVTLTYSSSPTAEFEKSTVEEISSARMSDGSEIVTNSVTVPLNISTLIVTVTASDGVDSTSEDMVITVSGVNNPPSVEIQVMDTGGKGLTPGDPIDAPTAVNFAALVDDPEDDNFTPQWGYEKLSGRFCSGEFVKVWGGSATLMTAAIGSLLTDTAITFYLNVESGPFIVREEVTLYFNATGCSGEPPPSDEPSITSFTTNPTSPTAGDSFTMRATASSDFPVTFQFYASGATTGQSGLTAVGSPITRNDCSPSCTAERAHRYDFPGTYNLEVRITSDAIQKSSSRAIQVSSVPTSCNSQPTSLTCSDGKVITVDAGCVVPTVGGNWVQLTGEVEHPDAGVSLDDPDCNICTQAPLACPAKCLGAEPNFEWSISDYDGLQPSQFSWNPGTTTQSTSLRTPSVAVTRNLRISLRGSMGTCSATDTMMLELSPESSTNNEADPALVGPVPAGRSVAVGDIMTVPVTVNNGGSASASDVQVVHPVPIFMDYLSPTVTGGGTCSFNQQSQQAVCSLGTIAAGSQKSINFSFEGNADGSSDVTVQLTSSSSDSDTSNNQIVISYQVIGGADVTLSGPQPANRETTIGGVTTVPITVTNEGSESANDVQVTQNLPTFLGYVSASVTGGTCSFNEGTRNAVCSLGSVAAGENRTINYSFQGNDFGSQSVTIRVSSSNDTDANNNQFTMSYTVASEADLSFVESGPVQNSLRIGQQKEYVVTVKNSGPDAASDVEVLHPLSTLGSLTGTFDGGTACLGESTQLRCELDSLEVNETKAITFRFSSESEGEETATITLRTSSIDPNTGDNELAVNLDVDTKLADVELEISSTVTSGYPQEGIPFTFTVSNQGPDTATGLQVSLDFPEDATVGGLEECTANVCSLDDLEAGENFDQTFTLTFTEIGTKQITGVASLDEADDDLENNQGLFSLEILEFKPLHMPTSISEAGAGFPENPFVGVAVHNPSSQATDVIFKALRADGSVVAEKSITDILGEALPPRGQFARQTAEVFDLEEEALALLVEGSPTAVEGFFLVGDGVDYLDGVAGSLTEHNRLYFPIAKESLDSSTKFFLYNASEDEDVQVYLDFVNENGVLQSRSVFLEGNGSWSGSLQEAFGLEMPADGFIRAVAASPYRDNLSLPIKGFELFSNGKDLSGLIAQRPIASRKLYVPHFVVWEDQAGLNSDTELRILNPSRDLVKLTVTLYDQDGEPLAIDSALLPSLEIFTKDVSEMLSASQRQVLQTGYIEVELSVSGKPSVVPEIIGNVTFSTNYGQSIASLPLSPEGKLESRFLHVAQIADIFTGLAVLNPPGDFAADVEIILYDQAGMEIERKSMQVGPGEKLVGLLSEIFEHSEGRSSGHFEVISSRPVIAYALFGQMRGRYLSAIEAQGR